MNALFDPVFDRRNRLLANPRVQRWLSRSIFTRWIARRRARTLFDLTAGFVYSQTLFACIKLDLFEHLRNGAESAEALAKYCELPVNSLEHLLQAAAALNLIDQRSDGRYALDELGAALIGNPGVASMILHHDRFYQDLSDPIKLLKQGGGEQMQSYWPYAAGELSDTLSGDAVSEYSALMADSQRLIADDVLDAFSFGEYRRILDLGGGEGVFVSAALNRWQNLSGTVFDLPAVSELANRRFSELGISKKASAVGGNLFQDAYPEKHDLVTLVRVLHDHDDESVLHILKNCGEALSCGGTLLIAEPMAGADADGRPVSAYFHLYLLAMGSGRPRTEAELQAFLKNSGFSDIRAIPTPRPLITRLIVAKKV